MEYSVHSGILRSNLLKRINYFLIVIIVLSNGYVIGAPLWPKLSYEYKKNISKPIKLNSQEPESLAQIDRSVNHLILPTIQLDQPVLEGNSAYTVNKGIWHRPNASSPDKGSNTVLVGHRFSYHGAGTFYNLDKLKVKDDIFLVFKQKIYHYQVASQKIVEPSDSKVEAPSDENKLTLYTCTPLWSAKQRLVIEAKIIDVS